MSVVRAHIWSVTGTSVVTNTATDFFLKFEAFPKITSAGPIRFCSDDCKRDWLCTGGTHRPCSCRQPRWNDSFPRSNAIWTLKPSEICTCHQVSIVWTWLATDTKLEERENVPGAGCYCINTPTKETILVSDIQKLLDTSSCVGGRDIRAGSRSV